MTSSPISVSLSSTVEPLWTSCHELENEMILTVAGRRIFPTLEYDIKGLDAEKSYSICIRIESVDDKKLRRAGGKWIESVSSEKRVTPRKVWHLNGVMTGKQWMSRAVTFDQIRITNKQSKEEGNASYIHLHTQHRYIPVLSIFECPSEGVTPSNCVFETRIPHSQFITVTAYHNPKVNQLKTNNNPYSTGSRKGRRPDRQTTPSSETCSEGSVSPSPAKKLKREEQTETPAREASSDAALPSSPYVYNMMQMQAFYYQYAYQMQVAAMQNQNPLIGQFPLMSPPVTPAVSEGSSESPESSESQIMLKKEVVESSESEELIDVLF